MLRLGSTIDHDFGPNTGAISLIYSHLLEIHKVKIEKHIFINHIGADLQEQVIPLGKQQIGVNIRWVLPHEFQRLDSYNQNIIFTEIINAGLMRIAMERPRINVDEIVAIRQEILDKKFVFDIPYRRFVNSKMGSLVATVFIRPEMQRFNYFLLIEDDGVEKCKAIIYSGKTTLFYAADLFFYGKWITENEIVIRGKRSEVEIHISLNNCEIKFVNLSGDQAKAPIFELFKAEADETKSLQDYLYSLNPALSAVIMQSLN